MSAGGWRELEARLRALGDSPVLVGLDFDGTLADIAPTPPEAAMSGPTRRLLERLRRRRGCAVAVLSGRALPDVKRLVGLPGLFYGGDHGLELEGPGLRWRHPDARPVDGRLVALLRADLEPFPGAAVEAKRLGVAVHYRLTPPGHLRRLKDRLLRRARSIAGRFRVLRGKKTFDLRPDLAWNKGDALARLRRGIAPGRPALYVGDDLTDEEAFRTLGPSALTVRVGRVRRTHARFALPHRGFVDRLLARLAGLA